MSRYDEFREKFGDASADEKLMILRSESKRLFSFVHGYTSLMRALIEERQPVELPDDFGSWCQKIADKIEEFNDLMDALTDREHRSVNKEEKVKSDKEFNEMLWKHVQQGLPELQNYTSLSDAIEKTAERLSLPLDTPEIKIKYFFEDLISSVDYSVKGRRIHIGGQRDDNAYIGYAVILSWLVDERNLDWQEHWTLAPSLEDVTTVLYLWLVELQDLGAIQKTYEWARISRFDREK